ncbi:MAG: ABC-F family ATP-binding cassette domain-containing protein [Lachnospiraceae bacterium]|nr:ABC-F family ATP-binding cassette domain-containing protein [Lachnospiraceae bacterium]
MNIINIENLTKTFGDRVILSDVSLGINEHDKIGIIGVNGTGKTTLLRMIAGIEEADSGNIIMMNNVTVSMLPQVPVFKKNETIISYVSKGGIKGDSWDKESEAKTILTRLGIGDFSQDINTLSGGQKKRVALARTLINPTDILIMDEPTNHLDNDMTEWLEEYLKKYRGVLIMVTHDRYFLDSVTNKIVEIDNKKLYSYNANYSGYLELKCQREDMEAATERKRKSILRNELKWVMRGARARSTKQKARLNRYEEMKAIRGIEEKQQIELESVYTRLGNKTIEVNNISKAYGEKHIINDFSYIFTKGINVGIVGNNGCGKTTFLDIISGSHEPDGGYVEIGDTVKIGYFTQEIKNMNPEERVIDYVRDIAEFLPTKTGKISASKMLERFLFTSDMQYTRIEKLSGGEKRRLYLLSILMKAPNILILDEPTNDLDISTLTVLEDYIDGFDGIVITVSHDRYFLDRVVDRILAFDGHGNINQYEGGYTDYRNKISGTLEPVNESKEVKVKTEKSQERKRKLSYNEKREYETIDEEIAELEGKIEDIEKGIAEKSSDYSELNRLMEEKEELESELEKKMDRWVYLNELVEEIEG